MGLSVVSAFSSVWEFRHRTGPFFFGSVVLLALAVAILFTVPIKGIRLLARRLVAFILDFVLFGLTTIGVAWLLFETRLTRPSALTSMALVWSWIWLFVLLDWRFAGTPGKKIMGLRLKGRAGESPSFLGCVARNLLTFVVPLSIAGYILSVLTFSKRTQSVEWTLAVSLLSLVPLSIAFSGGQSLPDLLLRLNVVPKRSHEGQFPASLNRRKWLFLVLASLLLGVTYGFMPGMGDIASDAKQPLFPGHQSRATEAEAGVAATLWPRVIAGVQDPEESLQDLHVYSTFGDLPTRPSKGDLQGAETCQASFKRSYLTIRLQLAPGAPTMIAYSVFANMVSSLNHFVGRPAFLVLEVSRRRSLGAFDIEVPEDYTLCLTGSNASPENNVVAASSSIRVEGSFNALAWLFLGDLGKYSYVEKCPIYPW